MIDKIKGDNNKPPDLRKRRDDKDVMKRVKGLVDKLTGARKKPEKKPEKRSMPRPRLRVGKKEEKPRLKLPKRPPERKPGLTPPPKKPPSRGIRPKIPEEDQRTLVGAMVFGIIIIIIVASGYYFLVYQPYQETLQAAKGQKLAEVDAYFKGPLATDPQKQAILAEIDSGQTPEEVLAVDVIGPATKSWRRYHTQEINTKKDRFNRVMIVYNTTENGNQSASKRVIMRASDAQKIVNEADATVLANMMVQTPDTVAVPIMISRLQAAGGLIGVGSMVDVYLNVNQTGNNTTTSQETTPRISGATVLAILRAKDSGSVDASILRSQNIYGFVCFKCLEPDDVVLCSECGKPKRYGLFPVLRSADGHIIRKSFCDECNRKLGRHKYKKPRKNKKRILKSLYFVDNIEEPVNVKKDQSGNVIINMKDVMKVFARSELNPKLLTETEKELYKSVLRGKWEVL